ncbi:MAG: hypothetical protein AAF141_01595 [Pseudomonadota bacterium]
MNQNNNDFRNGYDGGMFRNGDINAYRAGQNKKSEEMFWKQVRSQQSSNLNRHRRQAGGGESSGIGLLLLVLFLGLIILGRSNDTSDGGAPHAEQTDRIEIINPPAPSPLVTTSPDTQRLPNTGFLNAHSTIWEAIATNPSEVYTCNQSDACFSISCQNGAYRFSFGIENSDLLPAWTVANLATDQAHYPLVMETNGNVLIGSMANKPSQQFVSDLKRGFNLTVAINNNAIPFTLRGSLQAISSMEQICS